MAKMNVMEKLYLNVIVDALDYDDNDIDNDDNDNDNYNHLNSIIILLII